MAPESRPQCASTRIKSEPSANAHAAQERSQYGVEGHQPLAGSKLRGVNQAAFFRRTRSMCHVNEEASSISRFDQASDNGSQFEEEMPQLTEGSPMRTWDPTWGRGLNKLTKAMGSKMRLKFVEGNKRPEHPVQAAKLASESGIVVRDQMPIYPRWKDYKDKKDEDILKAHRNYLAICFDMDVSDKTTQKVCAGLLKDRLCQQRYRLKRKYDGVPENKVMSRRPPGVSEEDWAKLVEMWNGPKHKNTCEKNKRNQAKVKLHQITGSQCYIAKRYSLRDICNGEEPDSMDLFKASHFSKKKGFSDAAQEVIDAMKTAKNETLKESEEPKTTNEIVVGVLSEYSKSSKFLKNMGIHSGSIQPTSTNTSSARIRELEETTQQQALLIENAHKNEQELRDTISSQQEEMMELKKQVDEARDSNRRNEEQMAILKQKQETSDSILLRLLSQSTTI